MTLMKNLNQVKRSSKNALEYYDNFVMNSLLKTPKTPLPPSVTSEDSTGLTGEYESTHTDYGEFLNQVIITLGRVRSHAQKNHLYKITLLVGNFDEPVIPLLENAPSTITGNPSQFTEKLIHGGVIRVTAGLT